MVTPRSGEPLIAAIQDFITGKFLFSWHHMSVYTTEIGFIHIVIVYRKSISLDYFCLHKLIFSICDSCFDGLSDLVYASVACIVHPNQTCVRSDPYKLENTVGSMMTDTNKLK